MKSYHIKRVILANSRGGVLVLVALLLFVFIGVAALSIDIGYLSTTRNELQNVADAAALAGAGELGTIYISLPAAEQPIYEFDKSEITGAVLAVALQNRASGVPIVIDNDDEKNDSEQDIIIGLWNPNTGVVDPTLTGPDAVYVKARRDNTANSPISTFFAGIFGNDTMSVTAEAVASLSGPSTVAEGELITPFGLSENLFPDIDCTDLIEFSPTTESCAAWHNFFDPINANAMANKLIGFIQADTACEHSGQECLDLGLTNGPEWLEANFDINQTPDSEVTPSATVPVDFEFQGGAIASLFLGGYLGVDYNGATGTVYDNEKKPAPMLALFDYFRYRDGDGDDTVWSATIPVYKDSPDSCTNANTDIEILGFAEIVVISPDPPPSTNIQVHVTCGLSVVEGRGGGGLFGKILGTIPSLVK